MSATVFAPASIGNVGPGFDVLGLAVEGPGDEVRLERVDGPSSIEEITGLDAELIPREPASNVVTVAARVRNPSDIEMAAAAASQSRAT